MSDRNPSTGFPTPETSSAAIGLPVSGTSSGGGRIPPEPFGCRRLLTFAGDVIGVLCIFFLLFAGLFAGSLL